MLTLEPEPLEPDELQGDVETEVVVVTVQLPPETGAVALFAELAPFLKRQKRGLVEGDLVKGGTHQAHKLLAPVLTEASVLESRGQAVATQSRRIGERLAWASGWH